MITKGKCHINKSVNEIFYQDSNQCCINLIFCHIYLEIFLVNVKFSFKNHKKVSKSMYSKI